MTTREVPTSASTSPLTGKSMLDTYAERFGTLFDSIILVPTSITNVGDDYTIVIDPTLDADVINGMGFFIKPSANNTAAARLQVTAANPFYSWVSANGSDFDEDELDSSTTYLVVFVDGVFKTLTGVAGTSGGGAASGGVTLDYQQFIASGTWAKPAGLDDEALVLVEVWGGGGGGGAAATRGGGGGGAYNWRIFRAGDLNNSETVTVGSGGATGNTGGVSWFKSLSAICAYGGGSTTGGGGGGGGGVKTAGSTGAAINGANGGTPGAIANSGVDGLGGGGTGGVGYYGGGGGGQGAAGNDGGAGGSSTFGGGGGGGGCGGGGGADGGSGGASIYGGGGGVGDDDGAAGIAGTSMFGGAGGDDTQAGSAPGGGGGCQAAGARGEVRVRVIG